MLARHAYTPLTSRAHETPTFAHWHLPSRIPPIARHTSSRTHAYFSKPINRVIAYSQVLGVSVTVLAARPHHVAIM
jgi:hypothetical protein